MAWMADIALSNAYVLFCKKIGAAKSTKILVFEMWQNKYYEMYVFLIIKTVEGCLLHRLQAKQWRPRNIPTTNAKKIHKGGVNYVQNRKNAMKLCENAPWHYLFQTVRISHCARLLTRKVSIHVCKILCIRLYRFFSSQMTPHGELQCSVLTGASVKYDQCVKTTADLSPFWSSHH
ncbi:piggyBac transposable element-derived protein 4-like [Vespula maculifrons]|uniref:PiggyBac transposable element-derived protein 4-like n=1 Tax=Vespula maculifrons TaxID=7453 RepID=A0ABD2CUD9_VESMC